eukprot:scaffold52994_cov63-Phaeocystis_antarctica.AAC.2
MPAARRAILGSLACPSGYGRSARMSHAPRGQSRTARSSGWHGPPSCRRGRTRSCRTRGRRIGQRRRAPRTARAPPRAAPPRRVPRRVPAPAPHTEHAPRGAPAARRWAPPGSRPPAALRQGRCCFHSGPAPLPPCRRTEVAVGSSPQPGPRSVTLSVRRPWARAMRTLWWGRYACRPSSRCAARGWRSAVVRRSG